MGGPMNAVMPTKKLQNLWQPRDLADEMHDWPGRHKCIDKLVTAAAQLVLGYCIVWRWKDPNQVKDSERI